MIRLIVLAIWILGSLVFSLLIGGILSFTNEAQSPESKAGPRTRRVPPSEARAGGRRLPWWPRWLTMDRMKAKRVADPDEVIHCGRRQAPA